MTFVTFPTVPLLYFVAIVITLFCYIILCSVVTLLCPTTTCQPVCANSSIHEYFTPA